MTSIEIAAGIGLGLLGCAWHLAWTYRRARLAVHGRPGSAWLSVPPALLGPAIAIGITAWMHPRVAWLGAFVLIVSHRAAIAILQRRLTTQFKPHEPPSSRVHT